MIESMIVVFSGYNQRSVVAFLRTLEENNLDYQIIASGKMDTIFLTDYAKSVIYTRKIEALDLEEITNALSKIKTNERKLIAPSTEALNRFLLENREYFEEMGFIIPLVNKKLYEEISDKEKFVELCKKYKIEVPGEFEISEKFCRPLIAKPRSYFGTDGLAHAPIFLLNQKDQDAFLVKYNVDDFIFQEYVDEGRHVYLLFYFDKNKNYYVVSQENYIQQLGGKSMMLAKSSDDYHNKGIVLPYVKLFLENDFRGLVMVEIIKKDNVSYMIEANPRFWGPSQLFCDAGYNLFEFFLWDYGFINEVKNKIFNEKFYYWSNGIPESKITNSELVFHNGGKMVFKKDEEKIVKQEIYDRNDTKNIHNAERLRWLYSQTSKHSNYQVLPDVLKDIIGDDLVIKSRYEKERLNYIQEKVEINKKSLLDIGGNTGFFTIQSIEDGAKHVDYYEGNKIHADFVMSASKILGLEKQIAVFSEYYDFESNEKKYDVIYNLNVLHHMGDDFDPEKDKEVVKKNIIDCLNHMAERTDIMVFQLGFNWKGDRNECLFEKGEKNEMIEYIKNGTSGHWRILNVGIAVRDADDRIKYEEMNEKNLKRDDTLGEFLNRPLFIMKSVKEKDDKI